uniref:Golgin subfamily A conserved domain-containing protein n=1 Tax=Prolemur simus TaxID=1328070 RepID=A0A8C8YKS0_PROSS
MQNDRATISRAVSQNLELKKQLAELQDGFIKLSNDNMEITSALQSEQHVKTELAKKLGQLQEKLGELKDTVQLKSDEVKSLQQERDEYLLYMQQYAAAYQQLIPNGRPCTGSSCSRPRPWISCSRRKFRALQGAMVAERARQELQETQVRELLRAGPPSGRTWQPLCLLTLFPGPLGVPGRDGLDKEGAEKEEGIDEKVARPKPSILQDLEIFSSALASAEEEQAQLGRQLRAQKVRCLALQAAPAPGIAGDVVSGETYQALQVNMEKLQKRFVALMQEKVDLTEQVEELEQRCDQLAGETDTIGEYVTLYQHQRVALKQQQHQNEEYVGQMAREKEETKAKMLELQGLVMQLLKEHNKDHGKDLPDTHSAGEEPTPGPSALQELGAHKQGEVSLANKEPAQEVARRGSGSENHTAQQIMELLHEIRCPNDETGLGINPCLPYWNKERNQCKVCIT